MKKYTIKDLGVTGMSRMNVTWLCKKLGIEVNEPDCGKKLLMFSPVDFWILKMALAISRTERKASGRNYGYTKPILNNYDWAKETALHFAMFPEHGEKIMITPKGIRRYWKPEQIEYALNNYSFFEIVSL